MKPLAPNTIKNTIGSWYESSWPWSTISNQHGSEPKLWPQVSTWSKIGHDDQVCLGRFGLPYFGWYIYDIFRWAIYIWCDLMYSNENESFFIFNSSYNRLENALNFNLGQVYPNPDQDYSNVIVIISWYTCAYCLLFS